MTPRTVQGNLKVPEPPHIVSFFLFLSHCPISPIGPFFSCLGCFAGVGGSVKVVVLLRGEIFVQSASLARAQTLAVLRLSNNIIFIVFQNRSERSTRAGFSISLAKSMILASSSTQPPPNIRIKWSLLYLNLSFPSFQIQTIPSFAPIALKSSPRSMS